MRTGRPHVHGSGKKRSTNIAESHTADCLPRHADGQIALGQSRRGLGTVADEGDELAERLAGPDRFRGIIVVHESDAGAVLSSRALFARKMSFRTSAALLDQIDARLGT